jgi:hypothetical protein
MYFPRLKHLTKVNFTIVQGTNVSFVYCLDAYKPIAGTISFDLSNS